MRRLLMGASLLAGMTGWCWATLATIDGRWLQQVPAKERERVNPLGSDETAAAAGALIFEQRCASCHGSDAGGRGKRPSLRTERVHTATDGELQWLLRNGSLGRGMPSWSGLPETQRWQLVRYLHTLKVDGGSSSPQAESLGLR
jgi:mono/diheme cytochrome c family protein